MHSIFFKSFLTSQHSLRLKSEFAHSHSPSPSGDLAGVTCSSGETDR